MPVLFKQERGERSYSWYWKITTMWKCPLTSTKKLLGCFVTQLLWASL